MIYFACFLYQKDLSPLVKHLAPGKNGSGAQIPYVSPSISTSTFCLFHEDIRPFFMSNLFVLVWVLRIFLYRHV